MLGPGRNNHSWKDPAEGTWEFSLLAFEHRQARLQKQYDDGKKRKERREGLMDEREGGGGAGARGGGAQSKRARRVEEDGGGGGRVWGAKSNEGGAEAGEERVVLNDSEPSC